LKQDLEDESETSEGIQFTPADPALQHYSKHTAQIEVSVQI